MFTQTAAKHPDINIVAGTDVAEGDPFTMTAAPSYPIFITDGDNAQSDDSADNTCDTSTGSRETLESIDVDVVVDFSHPSMLSYVLALACGRSVPIVIATTGYSDAQIAEIAVVAEKIPVFKTANMSIGINLMMELVRTAAAALADGYDIELVESHHNQKLDAPSGTALMLADAMNGTLSGRLEYVYDRHDVRAKRDKRELGIHTIRGGSIVGEHSVIFAGDNEVIEIRHSAASRGVFAEGAVRAIRFIAEKGRAPGLYSMREVIADVTK